MKKNLFIYLLTVLCAVNLFTACSDDDDAPKFPIDSELAGNYKGKLDVKITQGGQEIPGGAIDPQFISVSKAGETAVNLAISDFSFMGIKIGDIKIDNCQLYEHAGAYSFAGTTNVDTEALTAAVNATGAFSGNKLTISMDIEASLKVGDIKQTVKVTYEGTKLSGNEKGESQILSFTFDKKVAPVDSLVIVQPTINEENKTITFMVADTAKNEHLKALVPTIEISEGATITPASGVAADFSNGKVVTYTVTAENGTKTEYKVSISGRALIFSFEEWETIPYSGDPSGKTTYELPIGGPWGSTNDGMATIKFMLASLPNVGSLEYPVAPSEGKDGKGTVIKTLDTYFEVGGSDFNAALGGMIPYNTAGSLFLGHFQTTMEDLLASTKFGIPYNGKEPVTFTGWYKYTPGKEYRQGKEIIPDKTDECDIYAVLYEAKDEQGKEITLFGGSKKDENKNFIINDSPYIVLRAQLKDKSAKQDWTYFELPFEPVNNKVYDASKEYKITFICTSSVDGANYNGAPGSVLTIDNFSIVTK